MTSAGSASSRLEKSDRSVRARQRIVPGGGDAEPAGSIVGFAILSPFSESLRRPLRQTAAQHAPLGRAPHGDHGAATYVPRVPHRQLQEAAGVQLGGGRAPVGADPAAQLHRIPAARRSTGILGGDGGHEHGARHAPIGARGTLWPAVGHDPFQRRALRPAGRLHRGFQCAFARLHLALRGHPDHCQPVDDRALLASTPRAPTTATHSRCSSLPYLFDLRWVHNPRQRSAPYCAFEKKDLTAR